MCKPTHFIFQYRDPFRPRSVWGADDRPEKSRRGVVRTRIIIMLCTRNELASVFRVYLNKTSNKTPL